MTTEAPPTTAHELVVIHDGDHLRMEAVCNAAEGATCRLWCDHECESGSNDRDDAGPFHLVDTADEPVRHDLRDQGECLVISYWNADQSLLPEMGDTGEPIEVGRFTVAPSWTGDDYAWEPVR